jgi:hypothetical protein
MSDMASKSEDRKKNMAGKSRIDSCCCLLFASVLLLCSCATSPHSSAVVPAQLPADVTMNEDAGRGNWLFVTLRLESGEESPFFVDTGTPITLFDTSLEPRLGKRLGTKTFWNFSTKSKAGIYAAPKLYLGSTRLMTGRHVYSGDLNQLSHKAGRPVMGILGMDCLRHYCIQLDFETGKMRFLNPDHVNAAELGKAFPLTFFFPMRLPFIHHGSLTGGKDISLLVDTGYDVDGASVSGRSRRQSGEQRAPEETGAVNQDPGYASVPKCVWNGETYTNLLIGKEKNLIGLRFLARHLVTFDFPGRRMYLKRTSLSPLVGDRFVKAEAAAKSTAESAVEFLKTLKENGQLPGWSKDDEGTIRETVRFNYYELYPKSATLDIQKSGDSSIYHYAVSRTAQDSPWKLERAWRTDQNDRTIEEYPVP